MTTAVNHWKNTVYFHEQLLLLIKPLLFFQTSRLFFLYFWGAAVLNYIIIISIQATVIPRYKCQRGIKKGSTMRIMKQYLDQF